MLQRRQLVLGQAKLSGVLPEVVSAYAAVLAAAAACIFLLPLVKM